MKSEVAFSVMRRRQVSLLILIALWLPIQAAAAVTQSFCHHQAAPVATDAASCHEQQLSASGAAGDIQVATAACDNCTLCHLAGASFLPAPADTLPLHVTSMLVARLAADSASYIPDPPQQPPRR